MIFSVTEDHQGPVSAVFAVRASSVIGPSARMYYETVDSSATSPGDYQSRQGTLTLLTRASNEPGSVGYITVPIEADSLTENNERLFVNLRAGGFCFGEKARRRHYCGQ